ncbi:PD-(D/E)XK nuclease family protein [Psychroflexus sp. MBR-150]|jgi:hypothetical protein
MKNTFLNDFVKFYFKNTKERLNDELIIMPSKRSVVALKQAFISNKKAVSIPKIIDIVSFIEQTSDLKILNHQESILEFYDIYANLKNKSLKTDTFENFYAWASVIISDFNELDRNLVDTTKFFEHHKALKTLNYFGVEKTKLIQSYIAFWESLPHYYNSFKSHLLKSNQAYQGLAYRKCFENISAFISKNNQPITFLGFNALNKAEEQIFEYCLKNTPTKIIWDIDQSFLDEKQHPSNTFISNYQKKWVKYKNKLIVFKSNHFSQPKDINVLSSPKHIGQAKIVSAILNNLDENEIENTAIVLNDEDLLNPILNSIPKSIKNVNITMGFPLSKSALSSFFNTMVSHQNHSAKNINYQHLKNILNHPIFNQTPYDDRFKILSQFEKQNLINIDVDELLSLNIQNNEIKLLLKNLKKYNNPQLFTKNILKFIDEIFSRQEHAAKTEFVAYQNLFLKLQSILESFTDLNFASFTLLFQNLEQSEKLNFKGSKSKGLQIMGMLESRLLDFDNVILTSVNEGILPAGKTDNSYITYNLKKQYNLPTHTEKDAIYAYHFFRLMQRSKKCYLIYDNDQSGFNKGEKSRFINYLQIFKSPNHRFTENQYSLSTKLQQKEPLEIYKTPEIILKLNEICENGLSPTALTTYVLNPILFYKQYVLCVKEIDQIDEVINPKDFGTVIHRCIETFYKTPNSTLSEDLLNEISKKIPEILTLNFTKIYAKNAHHSGQNLIQFETAKAYLNRFISKEKQDIKKNTIKIIEIEKSIETLFYTDHHRVKLKGQIDRIDICDDTLRIIDLKTGNVKPSDLKFNDFNQLISDYDYAKAFQILFYTLVYSKNFDVEIMKAGIISFKNLNQWFMPLTYDGKNSIDQTILDEFENYLAQLIDEILNPNIPFKEKDVNFES